MAIDKCMEPHEITVWQARRYLSEPGGSAFERSLQGPPIRT